jgi:hypothetical protein
MRTITTIGLGLALNDPRSLKVGDDRGCSAPYREFIHAELNLSAHVNMPRSASE